jgi:hypothetical protein
VDDPELPAEQGPRPDGEGPVHCVTEDPAGEAAAGTF